MTGLENNCIRKSFEREPSEGYMDSYFWEHGLSGLEIIILSYRGKPEYEGGHRAVCSMDMCHHSK